MKDSYRIRSSAFSVALLAIGFLASTSVRAAVVSMINVGGVVDITHELGSFSSSDMQTLITTTDNLALAGVLDAEGSFSAGDFSKDTGGLSDRISGAGRYARTGGSGQFASGSRWGFVSDTETWTPSGVLLSHFGLITSAGDANDILSVTVTYGDATTESATGVAGQTNWLGFHKEGESIISIQLSDSNSSRFNWANYDDVSLVFFHAPEPSSLALLGMGAALLMTARRRKVLA